MDVSWQCSSRGNHLSRLSHGHSDLSVGIYTEIRSGSPGCARDSPPKSSPGDFRGKPATKFFEEACFVYRFFFSLKRASAGWAGTPKKTYLAGHILAERGRLHRLGLFPEARPSLRHTEHSNHRLPKDTWNNNSHKATQNPMHLRQRLLSFSLNCHFTVVACRGHYKIIQKSSFGKIIAPIKIKSALLPPPQNPKSPPKARNFMGMGFSCRKNAFFQAPIKLAQLFPAPELRTNIFTDTRIFLSHVGSQLL